MKLLIAFFIGVNMLFANPYKFEKEIDVIEIAKSQSNLSENILENYFQQEYLDVSKQLNKDIAQFEENLKTLLQYYESNEGNLKNNISNNQEVWKSFKNIVSQPFDEANISEIIKISTQLLLLNESFALASQKTYNDNLDFVDEIPSI